MDKEIKKNQADMIWSDDWLKVLRKLILILEVNIEVDININNQLIINIVNIYSSRITYYNNIHFT